MSVVVLKDKGKLYHYREAVVETIGKLKEDLNSAMRHRPEGMGVYEAVNPIKRSLCHMERELSKLDAMLDDSVDCVTMDALEYQNIVEHMEENK